MKNLVLGLALIGGLVSTAEAKFAAYPHINGISIAKLCDTGDGFFRTKTPVQVCDLVQTASAKSHGEIATGNEFANANCRKEVVRISKSYAGKELVANIPGGEVSTVPALKNVPKTYPNTWDVTVVDYQNDPELTAGSFKHTIKGCPAQ